MKNLNPLYNNAGKNKVIKEIKKLAENAEQIYIAPTQIEKEAIAWHIANILKLSDRVS